MGRWEALCPRLCVCVCARTYTGNTRAPGALQDPSEGKSRPGDKKEGSIHAQAHSGVNIFCQWKFVTHIV